MDKASKDYKESLEALLVLALSVTKSECVCRTGFCGTKISPAMCANKSHCFFPHSLASSNYLSFADLVVMKLKQDHCTMPWEAGDLVLNLLLLSWWEKLFYLGISFLQLSNASLGWRDDIGMIKLSFSFSCATTLRFLFCRCFIVLLRLPKQTLNISHSWFW